MTNRNHRRSRQKMWQRYFDFFRKLYHYETGQARHYARMAVDKEFSR